MISYKHKCIFVHIPKTGGSSVERIIWPSPKDRTISNLWMGYVKPYFNKYQTGGMQHLLASQIKNEVKDMDFSSFFKFSIVRNPFDKVISQFHYMKTRKDLRDFIGMKDNDDFKTYLHLIQRKLHVQWEHQHRFILDEDENLLVDYIGKFENFETDVRNILKKIKRDRIFGLINRKIPHENKSENRKDYRSYYNEETIDIVSKIYQKDIKQFNYKF